MTDFRRAAAIAVLTVLRNAAGSMTIWSLEKKPRTSLGRPATETPVALAAPVARRIGSPTMFLAGTSGSSRRVARTRSFEVTKKTSSGATSPLRRETLCRSRLSPPKTRRNCFGCDGVERGQKRSPLPPARITALKGHPLLTVSPPYPYLLHSTHSCPQRHRALATSPCPSRHCIAIAR